MERYTRAGLGAQRASGATAVFACQRLDCIFYYVVVGTTLK